MVRKKKKKERERVKGDSYFVCTAIDAEDHDPGNFLSYKFKGQPASSINRADESRTISNISRAKIE